jgi:hypothetical protein
MQMANQLNVISALNDDMHDLSIAYIGLGSAASLSSVIPHQVLSTSST